jgi:hypothetical protein
MPNFVSHSTLMSTSIPMLQILPRSLVILSLLFPTLLLISGCSQSDTSTAQTPSETPTTPASDSQKNVFSTTQKTEKTGTEAGNTIELLYGKWKPIAYIDVNGKETDLTALPDSEKATLSWEFTPEGTVKLGEIEGSFEVQGNQIIAKNESSGNEKRFEFSVSETELTIVSDDGATLKLARE